MAIARDHPAVALRARSQGANHLVRALTAPLAFTLFEHYPLLRPILTDADLLKSPQWTGLAEFLNSLAVIFASAVTGLEVILGMNRKGPFQNLVRGAVFAPVGVIPQPGVAHPSPVHKLAPQ